MGPRATTRSPRTAPAPRADFVTGPTDAAVAVAVGVRGRAAIALGYEGAALPIADVFADRAIALSGNQPSLGLLNTVFGKAHTAALRGDHPTTRRLLAEGRRIFERVGSHEQTSDYTVPFWRVNVFTSLLAARLGGEITAVVATQDAAAAELPESLPRFATRLEMHRGPPAPRGPMACCLRVPGAAPASWVPAGRRSSQGAGADEGGERRESQRRSGPAARGVDGPWSAPEDALRPFLHARQFATTRARPMGASTKKKSRTAATSTAESTAPP